MKKYYIFLLIFGLTIISGCSDKSEKNDLTVIEINITEALKNRKDFPLSELVKDVEVLQLETNEDCFMANPVMLTFGKKFILVYDSKPKQFFLFSRQGRFIRRIGKEGKGPGEYNGFSLKGAMDQDEKYIVVADSWLNRILVYNIKGEVIAEKNLKEQMSSDYIENVYFPFKNTIAVLPRRPHSETEEFSSVTFFDLELNQVAQVLPRLNDNELCYPNLIFTSLISNKKGSYFWETYKDTVYQYFQDGSSTPKYLFNIEKNGFTTKFLREITNTDTFGNYTFVMAVSFLPDYLIAYMSERDDLIPVYYKLSTGETFSVGRTMTCDKTNSSDELYSSMENDIFGIEFSYLGTYIPEQNLCAYQHYWDLSDSYDTDCLRELDVIRSDIRDQLIEMSENPKDDQGLVLVLLHLK